MQYNTSKIANILSNPNIRLLIVFLLISIPICAHLGELPIQLWDESRLAVNALEMYKDHHWITTHYNGEPDMWNTKPPLLIWIQVACFHIFGINELALRIPSAIAGIATCLLLYWFFNKKVKNQSLGFIAIIILVSSYGFIKYHHSPRTGDYDAPVTFLITAMLISYYLFLEEGKQKYMYLVMLLLTLGVMTKSVTPLMFLPAIFLYTLYKRKLKLVLTSHGFYIGLVFFATVVASYYLLRESHNPGYITTVMQNELGGRFMDPLDNTDKLPPAPFYYFDLIKDLNFRFWYLLIPVGIIVGLYSTEKLRDLTVLSTLLCVSLFFIITFAKNKHNWYDMPMFPFLAIIAAIGIYVSATLLSRVSVWKGVLTQNALPYIFVLLPAVPAYITMLTNSFHPDPGEWIVQNTSICKYLKDVYHNKIKADQNINIVIDGEYQANIVWYAKVLQQENNVNVSLVQYDVIDPNSRVIVYKDAQRWQLEGQYNFTLEESLQDDHVRIYKLNGKK